MLSSTTMTWAALQWGSGRNGKGSDYDFGCRLVAGGAVCDVLCQGRSSVVRLGTTGRRCGLCFSDSSDNDVNDGCNNAEFLISCTPHCLFC